MAFIKEFKILRGFFLDYFFFVKNLDGFLQGM